MYTKLRTDLTFILVYGVIELEGRVPGSIDLGGHVAAQDFHLILRGLVVRSRHCGRVLMKLLKDVEVGVHVESDYI